MADIKSLVAGITNALNTAVAQIQSLVSEAEEVEAVEPEEDPFTAPEFVQATVRDGSTVHFQAGSRGSYRKGDVVDETLAALITEQIIAGEAVNPSLYGSKTQYATLTAESRTEASLANGETVALPAGLLS